MYNTLLTLLITVYLTKFTVILVALFSGLPFIGFGILDNTIMLTAVSINILVIYLHCILS